MSKSTRNAGVHVTELLTGTYGFSPSERRPGEFIQIVDAQHALVITDGLWEKRRRGKSISQANLTFRVARRDINQLWRELLNPEIPEWWGCIHVNRKLFGNNYELPVLSMADPNQSFEDFFDEWLPRFAELANLPDIRNVLASLNETDYDFAKIPRMMNTMLDGNWDDAAHEEFLAPDLRTLNELELDDPGHIACSRSVPLVQAWLKEHPDGIDRKLTT